MAHVFPQALERSVACQLTYVDLKVEHNALATVAENGNRSTDLVETRLEILSLPLPEQMIEVVMGSSHPNDLEFRIKCRAVREKR